MTTANLLRPTRLFALFLAFCLGSWFHRDARIAHVNFDIGATFQRIMNVVVVWTFARLGIFGIISDEQFRRQIKFT